MYSEWRDGVLPQGRFIRARFVRFQEFEDEKRVWWRLTFVPLDKKNQQNQVSVLCRARPKPDDRLQMILKALSLSLPLPKDKGLDCYVGRTLEIKVGAPESKGRQPVIDARPALK